MPANLRPLLWLLPLLAAGAAHAQTDGPQLIIDGSVHVTLGVPVYVPVQFIGQDHDITSVAFSLDLNTELLSFDDADDNGDGMPDDVAFPLGMPGLASVTYDDADSDGELDVLLANLSGLPLPDGPLLEIEFMPLRDGCLAAGLRFSQDPEPSFGNSEGQDVAGTWVVTGGCLFADGFESGDFSAWSQVQVDEEQSADGVTAQCEP